VLRPKLGVFALLAVLVADSTALAQGDEAVTYVLQDGSYYMTECQCCIFGVFGPVVGSFVLVREEGSPGGKVTYRVEDVDLVVDDAFSGDPRYTGTGVYRQRMQGLKNHEMELFLGRDGACCLEYESGIVGLNTELPALEIDLRFDWSWRSCKAYSDLRIVAEAGTPPPRFRRGDADGNGTLDLTDPIFLLLWLFVGGDEPGCLDAADSNRDGHHDLSDAVHLLLYLFHGGSAPLGPGPERCGYAPRSSPLGCGLPPAC